MPQNHQVKSVPGAGVVLSPCDFGSVGYHEQQVIYTGGEGRLTSDLGEDVWRVVLTTIADWQVEERTGCGRRAASARWSPTARGCARRLAPQPGASRGPYRRASWLSPCPSRRARAWEGARRTPRLEPEPLANRLRRTFCRSGARHALGERVEERKCVGVACVVLEKMRHEGALLPGARPLAGGADGVAKGDRRQWLGGRVA